MPPNNNTDILLRLLYEDRFSAEMDKSITHFEERMKKATSVEELESLERQWNEVRNAINEAEKAAKQQAKEVEAASRRQISDLTRNAAVLRRKAAEMSDDVAAAQISALKDVAGRIDAISKTALLAGGGIIGGVFAEVNHYVNNAKQATAATRAWRSETDSLAKSRARVDEVLAREALPMLRQVARFANQAATFVETHPEIVQAALNTGKVLITLGAVGTVLSKGIKLYADAKYLLTIPVQLEAAQLQSKAALMQLQAAQMRAGLPVTPGGTTSGAGGLGIAGTIGLIVAGIVASGAIIMVIDQILEKYGVNEIQRKGAEAARDRGGRLYPGALPPNQRNLQAQLNRAQDAGDTKEIERLRGELRNLGNQAGQTAEDIKTVAGQLSSSANESAIVEAFIRWKEDDKRLIQEAAENRKRIIEEAEKRIADITRQYAQQRVDINRRFNDSRADIIQDFTQDSRRAEIEYAQQRAEIIKDAGEEIQEIEAQHQENIRKMVQEHGDRVEDLTAARDALGLAKEQRQFDRDLSEAERETNQEIAQRRRQTAQRLQELASEYASERAQRLAQYQQSLAENEQNRQEELKRAAEAYAAELQQTREAKAQQLRELQEGLNAERLRRREVFIAEIRDLDEALLGERGMKQKYYQLMYQDAEKFFADWRALMPTSSPFSSVTGSVGTIPTHDYSGYAYSGLYHMAANGIRQFVMGGNATKVAERVIGGQLDERSLMRAMMSGGQITWNDNRRFDSRLSLADRRAITEDTLAILGREFA